MLPPNDRTSSSNISESTFETMNRHNLFATELQRRQRLMDLYRTLGNLIPIVKKKVYPLDRASVVGYAIGYIKELQRTVRELKLLVEKRKCGREGSKKHKTEGECSSLKTVGDQDNQSQSNELLRIRSSWVQKKSRYAEVNVWTMGDEVAIKVVHRKKSCLKDISMVLDQIHLDLHHVVGGHNGVFYSFLFNAEMHEGSRVPGSAIATKLIEVVTIENLKN